MYIDTRISGLPAPSFFPSGDFRQAVRPSNLIEPVTVIA
jgi:hypothetical protein